MTAARRSRPVIAGLVLLLTSAPAAARPTGPFCQGKPATISGTAGADTLRGTPGPDVVFAGEGDDVVRAGGGADLVCGGRGRDTLTGGDEGDRLLGGPGDDVLAGGAGDDVLVGGDGADRLDGSDGADRLFGNAGNDALQGGAGDDLLRGDDGADDCDGGDGRDDAARCEAVAATEAGQVARLILQPAPGQVALTFDDGPNGLYTASILEILAGYGVPATFFVVGVRVAGRPDLVQAMAAGEHSVQNHSYSHLRLTQFSDAGVVEELVRANEAITAVTADPPHCMRPPFLAADDRVRRIVAGLGLAVIISNVDPKDWSFPGTAAIVSYVLGHTDGGDIISLHEGVGAETLAALPAIIEGLQAKGLEFVALCSTAVLGPPG